MKLVVVLYCLLPAAFAMCFKEEESQGRRKVLRSATTVVVEIQCQNECAEMDACLAYFYQAPMCPTRPS